MPKIINKRRTFTVKEQLLAKLGPAGYGTLLDSLQRTTTTKRRTKAAA